MMLLVMGLYMRKGQGSGVGNDNNEDHLPAGTAEFTAFSLRAIVRVLNLRREEKERLMSM